MPEPNVFYFRAPQLNAGVSKGLAADVKLLFEIPESALDQFSNELDAKTGFLTDANLEELVQRIVPANEHSAALLRLFRWAEVVLRSPGNTAETLIDKIGQSISEDGTIPPEQLAAIGIRVKRVLRLVPGRELQHKAEKLSDATGLKVESVDLICDLRPVFDGSRVVVEGFIPFTTIRIVASGVDKFPVSFEAVLSADELQKLVLKSKQAVVKLNALGELVAGSNLPVPIVDLTETSD